MKKLTFRSCATEVPFQATMISLLSAMILFFSSCSSAGNSCNADSDDSGAGRPPVIGVSCAVTNGNSRISRNYTEAVIKAGGIPLMIPVTEDTVALASAVDVIDGLIMTGGEDIAPSYYGEEPHPKLGEVDTLRDTYDIYLLRKAVSEGVPVLGICRGEQLINVAFGGTLYQDIPSQHPSGIKHNQEESGRIPTHAVTIVPGTDIAGITGIGEYMVNTFHHQAVKDLAPGFRIAAWAKDSIPEAIECTDGRAVWGVQFHPEILTAGGDTTALRFFRFLVSKAVCRASHD